MKVIKAKTAGFCFGVKRAVDTVYEQARYMRRPDLYLRADHPQRRSGQRSGEPGRFRDPLGRRAGGHHRGDRHHPVPRRGEADLRHGSVAKGLRIVDATCPFVKKIHNIVEKESAEGKYILIIGNPDHPEVSRHTGMGRFRRVCHPEC